MKVTMYVYGGARPLKIEPKRIQIEATEGLHDMATLSIGNLYGRDIVSELNLGDVNAKDVGPPAALEVVANNNTVSTFYGYVDTTIETRSRINDTSVDIYFLAATSVMRNGTPRVWRDKTPFQIAGELLAPYGLGLEMDKLPNPMASFAQSKESDWETLRNLATLNGLSLSAKGPIVYLRDVINETRRARGSNVTPLFRRPGSGTTVGLECSQFTQVASRTPVGGERYRYYGIDQLGTAFEVTGGVSVIEKAPGTVVRSLGAALREARRHDSIGRFVTRATLDANGVVGCDAGTCIAIDNNRIPEYWYIVSSKHVLVPQRDEYSMTLELCRQDGVIPGYISTTVAPRPNTVLIGKNWRCDRSWRVQL